MPQGKNILTLWIEFQFFDVPKAILEGWGNFLKFYLNYFSIPLLLKTLFSPWRGYRWISTKKFDIGEWFEVRFSNSISRTLGAIMRVFLIFIGLFVEVFLLIGGIIVFFCWLIFPVLLLGGLYFGFKILF